MWIAFKLTEDLNGRAGKIISIFTNFDAIFEAQ